MARVAIDTARCVGHGRCYDVAPQLFDCDDEGHGSVIEGVVIDDTLRERARQAAQACPERAVTFEQ